MIESLLAGMFLAGIYSFCVQKWVFRSASSTTFVSRGRLIVTALLRLIMVAAIFFLLSKIAVLKISMVMLSFIIGVSFCLFYMVRKAIPTSVKAGNAHSQGRF